MKAIYNDAFWKVVRSSQYSRLQSNSWKRLALAIQLDKRAEATMRENVFKKTKIRTRQNIETGWMGGLCAAKAKETWTRFADGGFPANHMDNYSRHGLGSLYNRLAWRRHWHERAVGGWSGRAFMLLDDPNTDRKDIRGRSMGCPDWYSEHHP